MIQKCNGEFVKSNIKTHLYFIISRQNLLFVCKMVGLVVFLLKKGLYTSVYIYKYVFTKQRLKRVNQLSSDRNRKINFMMRFGTCNK